MMERVAPVGEDGRPLPSSESPTAPPVNGARDGRVVANGSNGSHPHPPPPTAEPTAPAQEPPRGREPLWARFCEELVGDAMERSSTGRGKPQGGSGIHWPSVGATGGDRSPAEVAGRAVMAAHFLAGTLVDLGRATSALPGPVAPPMSTSVPGGAVSLARSPAPAPPPPRSLRPPPPRVGAEGRAGLLLTRVLPPPPPGAGVATGRGGAGGGSSVGLRPPPPPTAAPVTALPLPPPPRAVGLVAPSHEPVVVPSLELSTEARRRGSLRQGAPRALFAASGWVQNIGLIMLLFAAWQLWGTSIQHNYAQQTLRTEFQVRVHHFESTAPSPTLVSSNAQIPQPANGSVVGHLQIPAIGVDQYVVEGTAVHDLSMGPGHYLGTSMPGQAGNVGIAGHRTTYGAPFNNLDHLAINDQIILTTDSGEALTYVVAQPPFVVSPHDVTVLDSGNDDRLTLTTCNPRFSDTSRLVVVALLSQPSSASGTQVTVVPRKVLVAADDTGWNFKYLPEALALVALLVLLGLVWGRTRRLLGRLGRALVLTPAWAAGLYFLFEALIKLLPANL